MKIQWWAR